MFYLITKIPESKKRSSVTDRPAIPPVSTMMCKFKIHNIKLSLKFESKNFFLNRDRISYLNEKNKNFTIIKHNSYTYIIFKPKKREVEQHCNITKIPCFCLIFKAITSFTDIVGSKCLIKSFKIDNITCTLNIEKKIELKKFLEKNLKKFKYIYYLPERFPAVFIRLCIEKGTCLFFSSGKIVLVGFSNYLSLISAVKHCFKALENYYV